MREKEKLIRNKSTWRIVCFVLCVMFIAGSITALSGCGKKAEEQQISKQLKLYFANENYIETGDETKGALVEYDDKTIYLPEKTPKDMTEEEADSYAYTEAITHLWKVPNDLDNADTMVTEKFGMHDITCKDGTAYVDLVGKDLKAGGGSLEETLFISQITETLINSFDEIEKVQFLVDGKEVETLMGHCDTTEPLTGGLFQK